VRLEVYDTTGRRVRLLAEGALPAGSHAVRWDGTDQGGAALGSGVYLVRLTAGDLVFVRKALLVR
jgi:flagellar hook assembly protein FlgD